MFVNFFEVWHATVLTLLLWFWYKSVLNQILKFWITLYFALGLPDRHGKAKVAIIVVLHKLLYWLPAHKNSIMFPYLLMNATYFLIDLFREKSEKSTGWFIILSKTVSNPNHGNNVSTVACHTSKKLTNIAAQVVKRIIVYSDL